jgi:hypothetical protein
MLRRFQRESALEARRILKPVGAKGYNTPACMLTDPLKTKKLTRL